MVSSEMSTVWYFINQKHLLLLHFKKQSIDRQKVITIINHLTYYGYAYNEHIATFSIHKTFRENMKFEL